ncbi:MAG: lytic murein transglycosylase [Hyphomicrobiales bacterium]|nr:MAG: lytic murein transglycosylase [Hyphomicrobiales bacterium]
MTKVTTERIGGLLFSLLIVVFSAFPAEADAKFDRWVRDFWPKARAAGISSATYKAAFAGVTPDPEVLEKARYQPEFVKPIWEYMDSAVSETRVTTGREKLREWKGWLDRIEAKYGVDRHVVVAIWGMESSYGAVLDNPGVLRNVIRSLSTLAYAGGRRSRYGRQQLVAALKIVQRGDVSVRGITGSWAGAMGHTQFIPTTFDAYGVDMDGDGHRNIWTSIPDALGSTAAYLKRARWNPGETWGYEVQLPRGFNYALADKRTQRTLKGWQDLGISRVGGRDFPRPDDKAALYLPGGAKGPAFLMLRNFKVIKRYNNADAYALAVGHLSDRLRGGGTFARDWPRDDAPLGRSQTKQLQKLLAKHGYDTGGVDGKVGPKTMAAIIAVQKRLGWTPDGYAGTKLLKRLGG